MCLDVHIERKLVKANIAVHVDFGLMLRWQRVTQEVPV